MRRGASAGAAAALLAVAASSFAEPVPATSGAPSVELAWSGPDAQQSCMGKERLERAVDDYLGREAFSTPPADRKLEVQVTRGESGWRALIKVQDSSSGVLLGERELNVSSELCSSLDEPLTLAVALMVDSELSEVTAPRAKEPEASPTPAAPLDDLEPEAPRTAPAPKKHYAIGWSADARFAVENGALPNLGVGAEVGVEARVTRALAVRAHGVGFLPQELGIVPGASARLSLFYAGLALCPDGEVGESWKLGLCAGLEFGVSLIHTRGLSGHADTARRVAAGSLGARTSLKLTGSFALVGGASLLFPYRPDRFVVEVDAERREIFKMAAPSWVASLGGSVMF